MLNEYSARCHVGKVRENNEDNLYVDGVSLTPDTRERPFTIDGIAYHPAIFAVCDGMGGGDDGEIASLLAIQALNNADNGIKSAAAGRLGEAIQTYVDEVSESIFFETDLSGKRAGTTLALAAVLEDGVFCFNLGDSRIYGLQNTVFKQITNDHTLSAEQKRSGVITQDQAIGVKDGNKLTRCIGIGAMQNVESYPALFGECRILICSDGLTDMVDTKEIENIMRISKRSANAADSLLSTALANGGKDNVTIIVVDVKSSKT